MRLIVYLLIAKGVLFAVTMMLPDQDEGRVFGAAGQAIHAAALPPHG